MKFKTTILIISVILGLNSPCAQKAADESVETNAIKQVLVDYNSSFPPILQEVFGEFENLTAIEYLIRTLADSQAGVRAAAAETLGKIGHPNAVGALMGLLQDTEPDVRAMAVWALDEINI